ncbi:MAG: hypothetical protein IT292_08600 [Deltaproteobacteria bacterium]|nr:hypothetical protein [Deltaproteobacteria bacterium]
MNTKYSLIIGMVLGSLVAAGVFVVAFRPPFPPPPHHGPFSMPHGPRMMGRAIIDHLADKLDLTAEQKQKAEPIVKEMHAKMMALRLAQSDQADIIREEANRQLKPLLDEAQRQKLAEMSARFKKMREQEEEFMKENREPLPPQ